MKVTVTEITPFARLGAVIQWLVSELQWLNARGRTYGTGRRSRPHCRALALRPQMVGITEVVIAFVAVSESREGLMGGALYTVCHPRKKRLREKKKNAKPRTTWATNTYLVYRRNAPKKT